MRGLRECARAGQDALKALLKLNDRVLRGRKLSVTYASQVGINTDNRLLESGLTPSLLSPAADPAPGALAKHVPPRTGRAA